MRQHLIRNLGISPAVLFIVGCTILSSGCATSPGWPMENIGPPQFSGKLTSPGPILLVPTAATRSECRRAIAACQQFIENLAYAVNTSGAATAHPNQDGTPFSIVYEETEAIETEVRRVGASHVLVWDIGIIEDRKNFSFGPDAFSVSTLKIFEAATGDVSVQMTKPYGMINPNTEDFVILAAETGRRLGRALAQGIR